jgi:hypothetical protein
MGGATFLALDLPLMLEAIGRVDKDATSGLVAWMWWATRHISEP